MPTIEKFEEKPITKEITVNTKTKKALKDQDQSFKWWLASTDKELCDQLLSTTNYLTKLHTPRIKQASIYTRLFSGKPLYNYLANTSTLDNSNQLPIGRPTANVVYSCTDTFVSKITQNRPKPTFLTNEGHYKEQKLAKEYNNFLMGEFYRTKAYELRAIAVKDACVLGNGFVKVIPDLEYDNKGKALKGKVKLERTLETELFTDFNDAYYGSPRSLIQKKLVDRGVMIAMFPDKADMILKAEGGTVDNSPQSSDTVTDQFIIAEGWHLSSSPTSGDGRHSIICSLGVLEDDQDWKKTRFPFAKWSYNPNMVGWFAQGLAEILMPTQMEIYKLLIVASQAMELMGVPRILIDEFSAILETAFNNNLGTIIKYNKVKPEFVNPVSNNAEIYEWIKWLIQNAYQISGISSMEATSQKPAGLNSGEAIRSYDDIATDRRAAFAKRDEDSFTDLAYLVMDTAADIAKETGSYSTVYPGKDGTREVDLPKVGILEDTYVIQCMEESSLPNDPAGRRAKLSEMLAAGEITNSEFRRLSAFPDLQQADSLAFALEERILHDLDAIIEDGKKGYCPPDPFILDPTDLATKLTVNYINKYSVTDLEEGKMQLLRDYFTQVQNLKAQSVPPPPQPMPGAQAGPLPVAPPQPSMGPTSGVQV